MWMGMDGHGWAWMGQVGELAMTVCGVWILCCSSDNCFCNKQREGAVAWSFDLGLRWAKWGGGVT